MGWLDRFRRQAVRQPSGEIPVVLYTRVGCCLCDDAKIQLDKYRDSFGLKIREVDIDLDPELVAKYDHCVPVVVVDGVERFRGRISEVLLRRLLRQRVVPE